MKLKIGDYVKVIKGSSRTSNEAAGRILKITDVPQQIYAKTFYMSSHKYCGGIWEDELTLINLTELEKLLVDSSFTFPRR